MITPSFGIKLLLAYSCGLIDRLRGTGDTDAFYSKSVEALIYGLFVAVLVGITVWWQVILFAGLWLLGGSFGWGEPLGALMNDRKMNPADYEWWQFGVLKDNALSACSFRGLMWGASVTPVAYFVPVVTLFPLIMAVVFPSAILLARKFKYVTKEDWARQEFYRGWLVGLTAFVISYM